MFKFKDKTNRILCKGFAVFLFFTMALHMDSKFVVGSISVVNKTESGYCMREDGDLLVLTCAVEDEAGTGATVWSGNTSIFDCPNFSTIYNRKVYLIHREFEHPNPRINCTSSIVGELIQFNGTHYTSRLSVSTTYNMTGGFIFCRSYYETEVAGKIQISVGIVPAAPERIDVHFTNSPKKEFKFVWSMPNAVGGVSGFHTQVIGNDCGNCSNFVDSSFQGTELFCSGWVPNEQVCRVMVKTVTSDCGFMSETPATKSVQLRSPNPPVVTKISPTYSWILEQDLESLLVIITLTEEKVDKNGLPITYGVYLEDSVYGQLHCVVLATAETCDVGSCSVAINMSKDCSGLEQDSLLSIRGFAETLIGRSLSDPPADLIDSRNKFVELSMVTTNVSTFVVLSKFSKVSETLSTSVQYGACNNTLTLEKQVQGVNDSVTCVAISDLNIEQERNCFIITSTTDMIPFPVSIRGEFIRENNIIPSSEDYYHAISFGILGTVLMSSLFFNIIVIIRKGYIMTKVKLPKYNSTEQKNNPIYEEIGVNRKTGFDTTPTLDIQDNVAYSTITATGKQLRA